MDQPVMFITAEPLQLARRRLEDDPDLAPESAIVGTYLNDHLIARSVADADWEPESDAELLDVPRLLHYAAEELEGGTIRAQLSALIPPADIPREPWQPEPDEDASPGLFPLGVVVRIPEDRSGAELPVECFLHFQAILQGTGEPVADRILKRL